MKAFFLKHYRVFLQGGILTFTMLTLFVAIGVILPAPGKMALEVFTLITSLGILLAWALVAFMIHQFSLVSTLVLAGLLLVAAAADHHLGIRDNPLTIPLIIFFWVGVAYLVMPAFFRKYQPAILTVYGLVVSYYFFSFFTTPEYNVDNRASFSTLMLFPLPVFLLLWMYEQWRWLQTLRADKATAELSLLRNQLNPHFFFNTLNNLYGLAVEKSDATPAMILKLSDMMRYTIYDGEAETVHLSKEVKHLENFIELHNMRHQRKVNISFSKRLNHPHEIAPLLLIVPLENAFKHGVECQVADAFIDLNVETTKDKVYYWVRNNFEENTSRPKGIGLNNLGKRLKLLYPHRHKLEILSVNGVFTLDLKITT